MSDLRFMRGTNHIRRGLFRVDIWRSPCPLYFIWLTYCWISWCIVILLQRAICPMSEALKHLAKLRTHAFLIYKWRLLWRRWWWWSDLRWAPPACGVTPAPCCTTTTTTLVSFTFFKLHYILVLQQSSCKTRVGTQNTHTQEDLWSCGSLYMLTSSFLLLWLLLLFSSPPPLS